MFHIVETESKNFKGFINGGRGNKYIGDNSIGLGCKSNDIISYANSELEGYLTYKLTQEQTNKILNATATSPITLYLERTEENASGHGVSSDICFSHMKIIDIIK